MKNSSKLDKPLLFGHLKEYRETMHVIKFMHFLLDNLNEEELSLLPHDHNGFIDIHKLLFDSKLYQDYVES